MEDLDGFELEKMQIFLWWDLWWDGGFIQSNSWGYWDIELIELYYQ